MNENILKYFFDVTAKSFSFCQKIQNAYFLKKDSKSRVAPSIISFKIHISVDTNCSPKIKKNFKLTFKIINTSPNSVLMTEWWDHLVIHQKRFADDLEKHSKTFLNLVFSYFSKSISTYCVHKRQAIRFLKLNPFFTWKKKDVSPKCQRNNRPPPADSQTVKKIMFR